MGDTHVRKSLISDKQRASVEEKSSSKSKPGKGEGPDSTRKVRVIAFTGVFVLLLAFVAYQYGWADREPPYEPPVPSQPDPEPAAPGQPRNTPAPQEKPPERHDVIQG